MKTFIIAAITADGFVGHDKDHLSTTWTTKADKSFFVRTTKEAGVALFGRTTYDTFNRGLPGRRVIVLTSRPDAIQAEGVEATSESPVDLVARLTKEGVQALAVCGGASVYAQFLEHDLVDELYLNVHPTLFGTGVPLLSHNLHKSLELLDVQNLGDDTVLLHYRVRREEP